MDADGFVRGTLERVRRFEDGLPSLWYRTTAFLYYGFLITLK